jgi:hypothetical protein
MRHALLIALPLVALLPGCAALQDTPAQTQVRAEWKQCEASFPTVQIERVDTAGTAWFSYQSPGALAAAQACIASVRAGRGPR